MAVEENVNWHLMRPIHDLVDGVRNRLSVSKSPSPGGSERSGSYDTHTIERETEWDAGQLISPRERVLKLLAQNEGGMKQSEIVSAVDWSESTVSRKLGKLEADGEIVRYRIGRGKCVYLSGEEPDVFKSQADLEDEERRLTA